MRQSNLIIITCGKLRYNIPYRGLRGSQLIPYYDEIAQSVKEPLNFFPIHKKIAIFSTRFNFFSKIPKHYPL